MIETRGYAAKDPKSPLGPFSFLRRALEPKDLLLEIQYCGVCHSDIHQVRDEWGGSIFPMVPGHEIVGKLIQKGSQVSQFNVGDMVGVGCFTDSCRTCESCKAGLQQYCEVSMIPTYNGVEKDGKTPTYGGYSSNIVVDEDYALKIPTHLEMSKVAPLLCAGITTYSPLRHWKVGKGHRVGVVGLGGLGHMAVKFASSFGAEVTVFSTSTSKEADAKRLGAKNFALTKNPDVFTKLENHFDFLLDSVSAPHDINQYTQTLKRDGTMIVVGVPPESTQLSAISLIQKRRKIGGSLIGGIPETQEMLNYCGDKNITSDVEVIPIQNINSAYERMMRGDVKYRFVIDMKTLK